jgi:hypothetical protein
MDARQDPGGQGGPAILPGLLAPPRLDEQRGLVKGRAPKLRITEP